jgi:hypothetical protein
LWDGVGGQAVAAAQRRARRGALSQRAGVSQGDAAKRQGTGRRLSASPLAAFSVEMIFPLQKNNVSFNIAADL